MAPDATAFGDARTLGSVIGAATVASALDVIGPLDTDLTMSCGDLLTA